MAEAAAKPAGKPADKPINTGPIAVTQQAAEHVRAQLKHRGQGLGIRFGVRTSGCSGLAYLLEFVDEPGANDLVLEQHGVRFYVDNDSLEFLRGSQVELVREGVNQGLRFVNPNATSACGCGESFSV